MAGYSSRSLVQKLGIRSDTAVILLGGPPGYAALLGELPPGATISTRLPSRARFVHQFARLRIQLEVAFPRIAGALADDGMIWISWPKRASTLPTDLTEDVVRAIGLALGLVDVKVCAVDQTWSGLKFGRRKDRRTSGSE